MGVGLYIIRKKDVKKDAKDAIEKRCKRKKTQKKKRRKKKKGGLKSR